MTHIEFRKIAVKAGRLIAKKDMTANIKAREKLGEKAYQKIFVMGDFLKGAMWAFAFLTKGAPNERDHGSAIAETSGRLVSGERKS